MSNALSDETMLPTLQGELRNLIVSARQSALRAVDAIQVQTYWEIGRHIVEFEQDGAARATYGKRLIERLSEALTAEFGSGFDERNLRHMYAFYNAFPVRNALRTELRLVLVSEEEPRRELDRERARLT